MEIGEALRLSRRRVALLLVVAVTAGVVAALVVSARPTQYSAQALVYLPEVDGTLDTFSVEPLAASLESAVRLPSTSRAAAEASGVPRRVVTSVETFREPGDPQVTVQITAATARQAEAGARALGTAALSAIATRQVENARLAVDGARSALAVADKDVVTLVRALGVVDIDVTLAALATRLAEAQADGADDELARIEAEINRLVGERPRFQAVTAARTAAQEALTDQLRTLAAAEAQVAYARSEQAVVPRGATEVDRRNVLVRSVVGAMVVAGLLGLVALVGTAGLHSPGRRQGQRTPFADGMDALGAGSARRSA